MIIYIYDYAIGHILLDNETIYYEILKNCCRLSSATLKAIKIVNNNNLYLVTKSLQQ